MCNGDLCCNECPGGVNFGVYVQSASVAADSDRFPELTSGAVVTATNRSPQRDTRKRLKRSSVGRTTSTEGRSSCVVS